MSDIDTIHETMLNNITDDYQKTIGFPTYDIIRAFAIESASLEDTAESIASKLNVDNLTGEDLQRFILQRKGLAWKDAVKATGTLKPITSGTVTIGQGIIFSTPGGVLFRCTEQTTTDGNALIAIEAVEKGTVGNVGANTITEIPGTIANLVSVTNPEPTTGGYRAETDDELRERYYEALQNPIASGNKYHYIYWAKQVDGVGDARCFPLANGPNTVEIMIIGNDGRAAAESLMQKVQEYIDPNSEGLGNGEAPIGAYCTVTTPTEKTVKISATVVLADTADIETVKEAFKESVENMFAESAFVTDNVSYAKIGSYLLETAGVLDYTSLFVNGGSANIAIGQKQIAVLGTVTLNA